MEHYFSKSPKSGLYIKKINCVIMGLDFQFITASGIFSKNKIDKGTLLLAESMPVKKNDEVLDIGCGTGVLGIVAAKLFNANVVFSDINQRAISLAKKNLKLNHIEGKMIESDLYGKIGKKDFDSVLSNPPQHAGKEVCFMIIEGAFIHLKNGGSLQLVARHNKGGKTLGRKMQEVFGNVKVISKESGYSVYLSVKNK